MKSSGIGGQAVIEGVMMKNKTEYAVAVRKPDQTIEIDKQTYVGLGQRVPFFAIPIIRGVVNFIESIRIGSKTLTYSASFFEDEGEPSKFEQTLTKVFGKRTEAVVMAITAVLAVALALGIFVLLPFAFAELLKDHVQSTALRGLIEGVLRVIIFISYVKIISKMEDIRRVFMYHGAEHKTINCVEHGLPLTVENVRDQSKEHKRCGTSFMLIVMFISILFFVFISVDNMWLRMLYRILLIPIIAGLAYECIRFAGSSDAKIVNLLSRPGLWLQGLTTKEPDDSMIEVAIASVEAVFDWNAWQEKQKNFQMLREESLKDRVKESMGDMEDAEKESAPVKEESFANPDFDVEEEDEILKALDRFFDDGGSEEEDETIVESIDDEVEETEEAEEVEEVKRVQPQKKNQNKRHNKKHE